VFVLLAIAASVVYWVYLQNHCFEPGRFGGDGEPWQFWKYRCP
jgi:hypothetical protein